MDQGTLSEGMNFLLDINLEPQVTLIVDPLWLLFLLRLEMGIRWPLGCNHKNWRMDFSELLGLPTLAFGECGVPLVGVLDVGVMGII